MLFVTDGLDIETQNHKLKEGILCVVCQSNNRDTVFLPCGDVITCSECASKMKNCGRCGSAIGGTVKSYMS